MPNDFSRIPYEMRNYTQFVVWRYEDGENGTKPTKIPYDAKTGKLASVTDPSTWATFTQVVSVFNSTNWYSGIGFVLSESDPYTIIDLDDPYQKNSDGSLKHVNPDEIVKTQTAIFEAFQSYTELSPSGSGLHIIVKGSIPSGRRRNAVEVYSSERYMTMTGNVYTDLPINPANEMLATLYEQMGGDRSAQMSATNGEQKEDDAVIIDRASKAANGELFKTLHVGKWQELYPSQSEADFAYVDILGFYTKNREQIIRIFRASALGQRKKAQRVDYINYMLNKVFDRDLPPIDVEGLRNMLIERLSVKVSAVPHTKVGDRTIYQLPPGLVGEMAQYIYESAPRPVPEIALSGAIGFLAGIVGRCYNYGNLGLNQYLLLLARTGTGKEAIASGISRITNVAVKQVPSMREFIGPAEYSSAQALIKYLNKSPTRSFTSVVGEFGLFISQMSNDYAPSHLSGLKRMLLDLYTKSGHGQVVEPTVYSDKEKNTQVVESPAVTILGESTPETFYTCLNENMIKNGLLPRFLIIEYYGKIPPLNENNSFAPSKELVEKVARMAAYGLQLNNQNVVINVKETPEAKAMMKGFASHCDDNANGDDAQIRSELWTRGNAKVMKLAALVAVGINPITPVIDVNCVDWAIRIVLNDIRNLLGRFDAGEIGIDNDETRQLKTLSDVIKDWVLKPWSEVEAYKSGTPQLHNEKIIPYSYISRRLTSTAAFKKDKMGASNAIKRAVKTMLERGDIVQMEKGILRAVHNTHAECYLIKNHNAFGL